MKRLTPIVLVMLIIGLLASCGSPVSSPETTAGGAVPTTAVPADTQPAETLTDPEENAVAVTGDFLITDADGNAVLPSGNVYTVTAAGEYTLSGALENGQIVVNAGDDDEVKLIMNGASVACDTAAPILFVNAGEAHVNAAEGTYNTVTDNRASIEETEEENYDAAIYAACDLKLTGKGTLTVTSAAGNGVKSKDDVKIKNVTLKVTAAENALKGNDSAEIESGNIVLISTAADGIKTSNTDVSAKGNQRGTVTVTGGSVDIYAACDGIDAAYNVEIGSGENGAPNVNIFTASYANSGEAPDTGSELYLVVPTAAYSEKYDYYAYFYNTDDDGVWRQFTYETMVYSGRSAAYYGLLTKSPAGYANIAFYVVAAGQTPDGYTFEACTEGETLNTAMNAYLFSSVSGKSVSGDWVQLTSGSGNSNKTAFSSKGIKAANEINISDGTVNVSAMDDGLHANAGEALENGAAGLGNINVTGGKITVISADDGMHADAALSIGGGEITITQAHEGLEANVIDISGGKTYVYGDDDGLNACKGSLTPLINITGGYLDVTTPSGDTDAIDSNGNFSMSGGFVLVKGGSSQGGMAGSVDTDGIVTVTGGSIVALGGVCTTPANGSVCTYISSGTAFSAGEYELKDASGNTILSFSLSSSYSSVWIASESIVTNGKYTLYQNGASFLNWTQDSSTVGSSGNFGGFGGMGQGGMGPGGMGHRGG